MPSPPSYSSARKGRQTLGARLGELRQDAQLTGRALARECGWSESKVSRIEHARTAPSAEDVRTWARACGASEQIPDLLAALRAVESMWTEWRRMHDTGLRRAQESVLPLWERTQHFRAYSSWLIPGAVQTAGYTTAVLRAIAARQQLPDDVEDAAAVRRDRLRLLREGGRRFGVIVEESVLRAVVGGADVMAGQLGHLLTVMSLPSVSLGVIPLGTARDNQWPVEDFWIFDDQQVSVELVSGLLTITQPGEIAMYAETFARLAACAVYGHAARSLITSALRDLPSGE